LATSDSRKWQDKPPKAGKPETGTLGLPSLGPGMNKRGPEEITDDHPSGRSKPAPKLSATSDYPDEPDAQAAEPEKGSKEGDEEIMERLRKRHEYCCEWWKPNFKAAREARKFRNGDQWPADVRAQRNNDRRPCMTIPVLDTFIRQVTNDQRANRPSIDVSPVGDGDKEAAKAYRGLIRYIERACSADIAWDTAFEDAVTSGFGYVRILIEWEAEDSFHQTIVTRRVRNPFTVMMDPDAKEPDWADARYGFVTDDMAKDEYEEEFPDAQVIPFDLGSGGERFKNWSTKDTVRIAEYYEVVHDEDELIEYANGYVAWKDKPPPDGDAGEIVNRRKTRRRKIMHYKVNAVEILEREEWPGKWIPILPVIGNEMDIDGKVTLTGLIAGAMDAQRTLNYATTMEMELVALAPKAPFLVEEGQIEGHEQEWKNANVKSMPYLSYKGSNINGKPVPPPSRQPMVAAPAGWVQIKEGASNALVATTGIRMQAMANAGQEADHRESGRMLREVRRSTDLGASHYMDNLVRTLHHAGRQYIDLIQVIFDEKQVVTILRENGEEQAVTVDPKAPQAYAEKKTPTGTELIFNPNEGKYGVTVTVGPSYATKRIEASESLMEFVKAYPPAAQFASDLIVKNMDFEGAEELANRLIKTIPPNLLTPESKDMSPQVQALVQSQRTQIAKLNQVLQAVQKELADKQADRNIAQDKIDKDFEAKILGVIEKAETAKAKVMVEQVRTIMDALKHNDQMAANETARQDEKNNPEKKPNAA
jgi:hypothetical protein